MRNQEGVEKPSSDLWGRSGRKCRWRNRGFGGERERGGEHKEKLWVSRGLWIGP